MRPRSHDPLIAELALTGIVVCENFLMSDAFEDLTREVDEYMGASTPTVIPEGADEIRRYSLGTGRPDAIPAAGAMAL